MFGSREIPIFRKRKMIAPTNWFRGKHSSHRLISSTLPPGNVGCPTTLGSHGCWQTAEQGSGPDLDLDLEATLDLILIFVPAHPGSGHVTVLCNTYKSFFKINRTKLILYADRMGQKLTNILVSDDLQDNLPCAQPQKLSKLWTLMQQQ